MAWEREMSNPPKLHSEYYGIFALQVHLKKDLCGKKRNRLTVFCSHVVNNEEDKRQNTVHDGHHHASDHLRHGICRLYGQLVVQRDRSIVTQTLQDGRGKQ